MLAAFFARRYLFSRKSHSVINIIACVSTLSVAVPVAAMIVLLSVFNGFESLVRSMSSTFDADIAVSAAVGGSFDTDDVDIGRIAAVEGVRAVSFVTELSVLLSYKGRRTTATLKGVDDSYAEVVPVDATVTAGRGGVKTGDIDRAVVGQGVAYALGIRSLVDADVDVYALSRNTFSSIVPFDNYRRVSLPVGGVFALDAATDGQYVLTSLRAAQRLFGSDSRATALEIGVGEGADTERVRRAVADIAGDGFRVRTREEKNATIYGIMRAEKWGIFFISLLVRVIAAFSIVGTLAMRVIEKRGDVRTLAAMGADKRFIRSIFIGEGTLVSGIGAAAGVVAGVGLCLAQQYFGIITIPADTFLVTDYPVELHAADLLAVVAAMAAVTQAVSRLTVGAMIKQENLS